MCCMWHSDTLSTLYLYQCIVYRFINGLKIGENKKSQSIVITSKMVMVMVIWSRWSARGHGQNNHAQTLRVWVQILSGYGKVMESAIMSVFTCCLSNPLAFFLHLWSKLIHRFSKEASVHCTILIFLVFWQLKAEHWFVIFCRFILSALFLLTHTVCRL